jgi:hypothetical protein
MIQVSNRKFEIQFGNGVSNYTDMSVALQGVGVTLMANIINEVGELYDPTSVEFNLFDSNGKLLDDTFTVNKIDVGKYSVNVVTDSLATYFGRWKTSDGDISVNMLLSIDMKIKFMMEMLRAYLDKSLKDRTQTWGYTDVDLLMYLISAVGYFNSVPPVTTLGIGNVPDTFMQKIIDVAVLYGIEAQMMYAIDTDVSYNDQGLSLNIDHFSKLSALYGNLANRVLEDIKKMKTSLIGFSMIKSVMAFNPERARTYMFTNLITPGFPYFAFGMNLYNIFI